MTSTTVRALSAANLKNRPEIRPGYTVRVHERIQEGEKGRVQVFEGLVIAVHKGATPTSATFTVRRIASGIGVEKIFPLHSPSIEKIEVKKVADVRRAKLFFLRGRRGKAARLSERFTTAEEFAIAAPAELEAEEARTDTDDAEDTEESEEATPDSAAEDALAETAEKKPKEETQGQDSQDAEDAQGDAKQDSADDQEDAKANEAK